jgi:hypothetical protein
MKPCLQRDHCFGPLVFNIYNCFGHLIFKVYTCFGNLVFRVLFIFNRFKVIEGGGDDREEPMLLLLLLLLQQQITFWIGTHATHSKACFLSLFKLLHHFNCHVEKEHIQAHCCPQHVSK